MRTKRMKRIPIKPSKTVRNERHNSVAIATAWVQSPPFAVNPRGVLTHRVKHVTVITIGGKLSHFHVDYHCMNGFNVDKHQIHDVLTDDPPEDRLLCERCEIMAAIGNNPSGDTLAGRHVHRGVLVPQQTCCGGGSCPS